MAATVGGVAHAHSCYASLILSAVEFEYFMWHLERLLRKYRGAGVDLVFEGDFNVWSASLRDRLTNPRGIVLVGFASSLGLVMMNSGREPTLFGRGKGSCVDVTYASETAARKIRG